MATCARYELDMTGARFGDCKCGHGKAEHSAAAQTAGPAPHPPAEKHAAHKEEHHVGACDNFHVDMNASEFGLCKCGYKKADHGKPREAQSHPAPAIPASRSEKPPPPAAPAPSTVAAPEPAHEPAKKGPAPQPCNHFEIDVAGASFGFCKCGHSREEHKQAGTLHEPEHRVFAGGHVQDVKRSTIVNTKPGAHPGKQAKPCEQYAVDMNGKTFGDCLCGHAKNKHKQFKPVHKGSYNDPDEEEVVPEPEPEAPRVIVRDGTHPCEVFELDMKNTGGYGHCICSFSRLDHEQFHHDPEEWHKVKEKLTAPKEFT